jgi:hypothetical protein
MFKLLLLGFGQTVLTKLQFYVYISFFQPLTFGGVLKVEVQLNNQSNETSEKRSAAALARLDNTVSASLDKSSDFPHLGSLA